MDKTITEIKTFIEGIDTTNPGKKILLEFVEKYKEDNSQELLATVLFFAGMLAEETSLRTKAEAYESIKAINEKNEEELDKLRTELLKISEELSPTSIG